MFAATTDENGKFRISIRRIRTIKKFINFEHEVINVEFKNRNEAKACADKLNETAFDLVFDKYTGRPFVEVSMERVSAVQNEVIGIILDHIK